MRVGIDLGGTKIEGALVADDGEIVERRRVPTPSEDYDAILGAIVTLVAGLDERAGHASAVGLAMPGAISPATGRIKNANTVCLNGRALVEDLSARLARTVRAENDANCLVVSEVFDGAAAGAAVAFGVILGTGVGGGVYANGALLRGANAIAGEWGHNRVPWPVPPAASRTCYCGRADCVETWLSGPGLCRSRADLAAGGNGGVEALLEAARTGEAAAREALDAYPEQLAMALATVVNVLDPDVIVLGGGVSNLPGLPARLAERLARHAFSDRLTTRVVRARHGDSSGVRGAAWLWPPGVRAGV